MAGGRDLPPPVLPEPRELGAVLAGDLAGEPLGLYLHIPFCLDRCSYCSFVSTRDQAARPAVLERLVSELRAWGEGLGRPAVDTLYLGGGTPSVLSPAELERLLDAAREAFDLSGVLESTLEVNPGTVDGEGFQALRRLGFDRVSLGVQSLDDALLARLGRIHDAAGALQAIGAARRAGFRRISADLMLGIPGQRLEAVLEESRRLVEAGAGHLSIYLLDLDKPCPLKREVEAGRLSLPGEEEVGEMYEALLRHLPALGLHPYEISNHARPGEASRHNLRYWQRRPYLGLGPGAASHLDPWRWTACEDIHAWAAGAAPAEVQWLDVRERLAELPLLGLRMRGGVDWEALEARAGAQGLGALVAGWEAELAPFHRAGLLLREGPQLRLTERGMLLSNAVLQVFV